MTVPIQRFRVEHFKSLVDCEVELGRVNVLIGANGSGKSNLLEALGVLGAAVSGRVDDASLRDRGVRPGVEDLYKSSFKGSPRPQHIKLEAQSGDAASYVANLWNPTVVGSVTRWKYQREQLDGDSHTSRGLRSRDMPNTDAGLIPTVLATLPPESREARLVAVLQAFRIYSPVTHFLRFSADPTQQDPVGLMGGGLGFAVGEFIRGIRPKFPPKGYSAFNEGLFRLLNWSDGFAWKPRNEVLTFRDRFMAKGRDWLTTHDASEGALYVLFGLLVTLHPRSPTVVAIDNFDQALNPRLAKEFAGFLCEWTREVAPERQIILTCHNPLVLDGLPLREDPGVRLFAVDRNDKGHTVVKHLDLATLLGKKTENAVALSRLWVTGALGGVPDV